jgi:sugar/nucleoside kinase (ribokinase family)
MNINNLFSRNKSIVFLSIGDIAVDAFIKLKQAEITEDGNHEHKKICLDFGGKIAFESSTEITGTGNSANSSISISRLGVSSGILTHTGGDHYGNKNREILSKNNVDTRMLINEDGKKTNYHYILWYDHERTILTNHEKYDYKLPQELTSVKTKPEYIYLTSLGENTLGFHQELNEYLNQNPNIKLIFQPGTFQIKFEASILADLYKKTEIFFCNREEAISILKMNESDSNIKNLLSGLKNLGIKLPVITDGPEGSYTYNESNQVIHLPIYPDTKTPLERTGAGDAFASTFCVAKYLGYNNETALMWGSINSMSVCQHIGATEGLLARDVLEKYLKEKPIDWNVNIIL